MRKPAAQELKCVLCGASNAPGSNFCSACGSYLKLDANAPKTGALHDLVSRQVAAAISEKLSDKTVVEVEIAEKIAERTIAWAKLAGFFIGIPVALIAAIIAFFGLKTYADFEKLSASVATTQQQVTVAQGEVVKAQTSAQTLVTELEAKREVIDNQVGGLTKQIADVQAQLLKAEQQFNERQTRLEDTFNELLAGRISLDPEFQSLKADFEGYLGYLDGIGFPKKDGETKIVPSDQYPDNVMFNAELNEVQVGRTAIADRSSIFAEYMHRVLLPSSTLPVAVTGSYGAAERALADYLPAGYLDAPHIGVTLAKAAGLPFLRNLENDITFAQYVDLARADRGGFIYQGGEALGGLFWALGAKTSHQAVAMALATAWTSFKWQLPQPAPDDVTEISTFLASVFAALVQQVPDREAAIVAVWDARGFPR